jgi:prophage antirepressor-like protein
MNEILNIHGIECYEENGTAYLKLETVARGLGFTDNSKGTEYVRWSRLDGYLREFNFATCGERPEFIPENIFYRLAMKANNEAAEKFQALVADEIIPSIRKTGGYRIPTDPMSALKLMFEVQQTDNQRINDLEGKVSDLAENAPLTPSEYGYLNNLIASRVKEVKQVHQMNLNKRQNSYLYNAIGRDVKQVANVKVRSQIRSKDFDKVTDFIKEWEPSKAVMVVIQDLV